MNASNCFIYHLNLIKVTYKIHSPGKRCGRVDISASQKQDSWLYKERNPRAAQADILMYFSKATEMV